MQEIMDNDIHIYSGEIDEEEDSPEVKELRVRAHTTITLYSLLACSSTIGCYTICSGRQYHTA